MTGESASDGRRRRTAPAALCLAEGMKVGDVSVGLSPQGFSSGGSTTPVPMNPSLETALKASGITVRVVAAQTYPNRVVAPALEVSVPFDSGPIPGGQYKGTMTVILGFAMAAMTAGEHTNAILDVTADPAAAGTAPMAGQHWRSRTPRGTSFALPVIVVAGSAP